MSITFPDTFSIQELQDTIEDWNHEDFENLPEDTHAITSLDKNKTADRDKSLDSFLGDGENHVDYDDVVLGPIEERITNAGVNGGDDAPRGSGSAVAVFHGNLQEGRKRRRRADPSQWKRQKNKLLRMQGQEYVGFQKKLVTDEHNNTKLKFEQSVVKDAKSVGPRCKSSNCLKKPSFHCTQIPESVRTGTFDKFWQMDWGQKEVYISGLVDRIPVKKKTKKPGSRRKGTFVYHMKNGLNAVKRNPIRDNVKDFLLDLPKMPSHYCRSQSTKLYLEPIYATGLSVYSIYKEKCKSTNTACASRYTFDQVFFDLNVSLFTPKKDQCDTCCSFQAGNLSETDYKFHQLKKREARAEKEKDKTAAGQGTAIVLTMDLESVKFTILVITTCYWWDETEGDLSASSFASCLIDYLEQHCGDTGFPVIVYSDGCTNQNRNAMMSNALLNFAMKSDRVIIQKFLEKGHTQMECDSVHSAVECKLKNREIHLPSDYLAICKEARKNPTPYETKHLTHDSFYDYSQKQTMRYASIRPGKQAGDAVVTNLRQIGYEPEGTVRYKLRHSDTQWSELPIKPKDINVDDFPRLHKSRLQISLRKWQDLQDLKPVLPADCHHYYDNLPH